MDIDPNSIQWAMGGIITVGAMVTGYLYKEIKDKLNEHGKDLSDFKLHVANAYSPKGEIRAIIDDLKMQMRDGFKDIKDFIEAKIK